MADVLLLTTYASENMKRYFNSEKFTSEGKVAENSSVVSSLFGLILTVLFCCLFIYIWIRTVVIAHECSLGDSICAFFFTSIYCFYKLGTLIRAHCAKPVVNSIF